MSVRVLAAHQHHARRRARGGAAASSSCRWASTPSFCRPGIGAELVGRCRDSTSSIVIDEPLALGVGDRPLAVGSSTSRFGAFIQLSGL